MPTSRSLLAVAGLVGGVMMLSPSAAAAHPPADSLEGSAILSATFDRAGTAYVRVSAPCDVELGEVVGIDVFIHRDRGRTTVIDNAHAYTTCTDGLATATVSVVPDDRKFRKGPVLLEAWASYCEPDTCVPFWTTGEVRTLTRVR